MKFRTTLLQSGKSATGLQVPAKVVEQLGFGKRPAVSVTLRRHTHRGTVAPMGGVYMLPVRTEIVASPVSPAVMWSTWKLSPVKCVKVGELSIAVVVA